MRRSQTPEPFRPFATASSYSHSSRLEKQVVEVFKYLQSEIPSIPSKNSIIPTIIISALHSVDAWPCKPVNGSEPLTGITRDDILEIGSERWCSFEPDSRERLTRCWRQERSTKKTSFCSCIPQYIWKTEIKPIDFFAVDDLNLNIPRDGPSEVWSPRSVHPLAGRRIILSYVHDKDSGSEVTWRGDRRSVRLTSVEATQVSRPYFLESNQSFALGELWHDGMKYPTPDGQLNGYAGMIPYMLPGSAVWHCVPRLRKGYGYPSLEDAQLDSILNTFAELRSGKEPIVGIENVEIEFADDKPYRDLSSVRKLWLMAEATCGMLRDDVLISIQDMAGVALTLMHYENVLSELIAVVMHYSSSSTIERKRKIRCGSRPQGSSTWAKLCTVGEGARAILKQTLSGAGLDEKEIYAFYYASRDFGVKVRLLKFWYALMLAKGAITNLPKLRFEILEDLAVAPAWDAEDRCRVYFMVEAAVINRLERKIPYEESIKRFLNAKNGGILLLDAVNLRSERIAMEMTRAQLSKMFIYNIAAYLRQTCFSPIGTALSASWLSGQEGISYLGRFTTSMSKQLYIEAARSWAGYSDEMIVRTDSEGKSRMVVLLSDKHRLHRYIDVDSKTEIMVCSIFFMNEDEYNLALSQFGKNHFHAEERKFRGKPVLSDTDGSAVQWDKEVMAMCVVDREGSWLHLPCIPRLYQIVVTSEIGADDGRLAAIRIACDGAEREPVAVSPAHIVGHITSKSGRTLFEMRPDQISPDGESIVDYCFEYEGFWAELNGRMRSTFGDADQQIVDDVVENMIVSLRTKHWR